MAFETNGGALGLASQGITKRFGAVDVLRGISLDVRKGELVALLGPSGCGKTTLLRILAGLDRPDGGRVCMNGRDVTAQRVQDRKIGFVFQHYALFRHMTVFDNVAFGLSVSRPKPSRAAVEQRVTELLELMGLAAAARRYPTELSGGQRQRVALARALAVEPNVLLLDEPFGALDARVRRDLRKWLRGLHDQLHLTSVFVTHDHEEALEMADRVVIMNEGRIEQIGTPAEVFEHPASPFVYEFLGASNVFDGAEWAHRAHPAAEAPQAPALVALARPRDIDVARGPGAGPSAPATVRYVNLMGPFVRLRLERHDTGGPVEAELPHARYAEHLWQIGDVAYIAPRNVRLYPQTGV